MTEDVVEAPVESELAPSVVAPDRADAPVSEVTERFLRAVIAIVPLERIEELHLFSPLRQSGVETGIAVVAARVPAEEHQAHGAARRERHTVYTARYRLVQKGPERGKWETDMVDEADAPLMTVETVVRGVQRRAGEASEIVRFSASQIARALRMVWPTPAAESETSGMSSTL